MTKHPSFEKSLDTLERIVDELESGHLTLDESLKRYEQGVAAHVECVGILDAAEKRIEELIRRDDGSVDAVPSDIGDAKSEDMA
ncbi:exodeoxyribonuclease VII small subunit [bacterium]|nr:exodeoxyribonuclease VII small subunit [bacterium]